MTACCYPETEKKPTITTIAERDFNNDNDTIIIIIIVVVVVVVVVVVLVVVIVISICDRYL